MAAREVQIDSRMAAAVQSILAALCIVVGVIGLSMRFQAGDRDVTGGGHLLSGGIAVAGGILAVLGVLNSASRVVVSRRGISFRSIARKRDCTWEDLVGIDFGSAPGILGTTVVCCTETGERIGTGVLRVSRRTNVFAFGEALDAFGHDSLAGERLRRYLESNGLFA